jgi:hypothetical protein
MRTRYLVLALLFGLGLAAVAAVPAPAAAESAQAKKIAKLVEQLGSTSYDEREKAYERLDAIGEAALPALRKAARSTDAEVRKQANDLVSRIEKRVETTRILAPKMVQLKLKDATVSAAVTELRKVSGYNVTLYDPENKLKDRKVTLDTGKVTFWKALDLLCDKAGVVEGDPNSIRIVPPPGRLVPPGGKPLPLPARPPAKLPALKGAAPGGAAVARVAIAVAAKPPIAPGGPAILPAPGPGGMPPGFRPWIPVQAGQIYLIPGTFKAEPTDYATSFRVRASDNKMYGAARPKEIQLVLQVSAEPRLQWRRVLAVKVDKAVDNNNQKLSQTVDAFPAPGLRGGGGFARPAIAIARPGIWWAGGMHQYTPVRFKKSDKESKTLKELKGTIQAEVNGESEALLIADNVLKAKGKTFRGKHGGSLMIESIAKDEKTGQLTIRFEMEQPNNTIADTTKQPDYTVPAPKPVPLPGPRLKGAKGAAAADDAAKRAAEERKAKAIKDKRAKEEAAKEADKKKEAEARRAKEEAKPVAKKRALPARPGGGPGAINRPIYYHNYTGVTLRDDKGKVLPVSVQITGWGKGGVDAKRTYQMIYQPAKEHGKVDKLVFQGRRAISVNIPFTLKDVKAQ